MEKITADLCLVKKLQAVIIGYLVVFLVLALCSRITPIDNLTIPIVVVFFWAGLAVLGLAIFTLIFTSSTFVRMAKADSSLQKMAQIASVVTLVAGAYILIYLVWGSKFTEHARQTDHNLVIIAEFSPVAVGLILLATHVVVVRFSLVQLKRTQSLSGNPTPLT